MCVIAFPGIKLLESGHNLVDQILRIDVCRTRSLFLPLIAKPQRRGFMASFLTRSSTSLACPSNSLSCEKIRLFVVWLVAKRTHRAIGCLKPQGQKSSAMWLAPSWFSKAVGGWNRYDGREPKQKELPTMKKMREEESESSWKDGVWCWMRSLARSSGVWWVIRLMRLLVRVPITTLLLRTHIKVAHRIPLRF